MYFLKSERIPQKWLVLISCFFAYFTASSVLCQLSLILPVISTEWSLSYTQGGLLTSASLAGMGASGLISGRLSDRYGRRKMLLGSSVLLCAAGTASGYAGSWSLFMFFYFFYGFGYGSLWGTAASYIHETWPEHQRGKANGIVMGAGQLGTIAGSLLTIVLLPRFGWQSLYRISFFMIIPAALIFFFVGESSVWASSAHSREKKHAEISYASLFSPGYRRLTAAGTAASSFAFLAAWGINSWMTTYLQAEKGMDTAQRSIFIIIAVLAQFFGQLIFGMISDRAGRKLCLKIMFCFSAVLLILFLTLRHQFLALASGIAAYSLMGFHGLFASLFTELYPTRMRNLGTALCFNIGRGVSALSPVLLGAFAVRTSIAYALGLCAVFFLAGFAALSAVPGKGSLPE